MVVVPSKMGRINKRTLLGRLQRLGLASRAELAKSLNMSQVTAGKIVDEFLHLGVLEEVEADAPAAKAGDGEAMVGPARLGRPGRRLCLDRSHPRFLAIELGVFETRLAALPLGASQEDHWAIEVKTPGSAKEWVRQLRGAVRKLPRADFWGVLISVPGVVDEQTGRVLFSPNLHWTEQTDLATLVRQIWDCPVVLVQEERALALGHQYLDPESEDFLLVDFGEGVGGAVIVAGQPQANPLPISGELGHTPVLGNKRRCGCGGVGCVETLVSTRGLLQSLTKAHGGKAANWSALADTIRKERIAPWLARSLDTAAVAIAGALNVLGLRHVIVTGSLTELPGAVMDHLSGAIVKGAMWARFGKVEVECAPRRRTAGLVAVGIDRLVLPMTASVNRGPVPSSPSLHKSDTRP